MTFVKKEFEFKPYWAFFAFGKKQFEEWLNGRDPKDFCDCWMWLVAPKEIAKQMLEDFDAHNESEKQRRIQEIWLKAIILYELDNHECWYTWDPDAAMETCLYYWATPEQVNLLFRNRKAII